MSQTTMVQLWFSVNAQETEVLCLFKGYDAVKRTSLTLTQIQACLSGRISLDKFAGNILVKMDHCARSVLNGGFDETIANIRGNSSVTNSSELIEMLASHFTGGTGTLHRLMLAKSVQEALLTCLKAEPLLTLAQSKMSIIGHLRRRGPEFLARCFLEYYVFNVVWFRVGPEFQNAAENPSAAVTEMNNVERACKEIVNSTWNRLRIQAPLDLNAAERLVREIQASLNADV